MHIGKRDITRKSREAITTKPTGALTTQDSNEWWFLFNNV
jgi:hypothetical protein